MDKIPKYIVEILQRGKPCKSTEQDPNSYGYTFKLKPKWRFSYSNQMVENVQKLIALAKRNYADSYIVQINIYGDTRQEQQKARRFGKYNNINFVLTDSLCLRLEKQGFLIS